MEYKDYAHSREVRLNISYSFWEEQNDGESSVVTQDNGYDRHDWQSHQQPLLTNQTHISWSPYY